MFWNVIDENRFSILQKIVQTVSFKKYYMAGGTALALQTGLRESFDFDFFVQEKFDVDEVIKQLETIGNVEVTSSREGTLHCILDNVQITFLYFPNNLIEELVMSDKIQDLYLASITDIAVMKLLAVSQRGTKKDFFDLYNICEQFKLNISDVLELMKVKYNDSKINYSHIIQSLTYFEDAEDENLPKVFVKYNWEDIKKFYLQQQKEIYNNN